MCCPSVCLSDPFSRDWKFKPKIIFGNHFKQKNLSPDKHNYDGISLTKNILSPINYSYNDANPCFVLKEKFKLYLCLSSSKGNSKIGLKIHFRVILRAPRVLFLYTYSPSYGTRRPGRERWHIVLIKCKTNNGIEFLPSQSPVAYTTMLQVRICKRYLFNTYCETKTIGL